MGTFTEDRAVYDEAFAMGEDRIAVLLDGQAPAPKPAPAPAPAPTTTAPSPAPPSADTGPGLWSRLGSGLSAVGGNLVDLAKRVEFTPAPISGARGNAMASLPPPPPPAVPWRVLAIVAAALVALAMLLRRP